jgi:nitrogen fixation/metabolism regulation signal transduction histidine kinase
MLAKSVGTIVNQVQAMKDLVNEFRDYARLPSAKPAALDLNALVAEVLGLYAAQQDSGRVVTQCEANLPAILGDASQLRQVIHNLVQNALDAVADRRDGQVIVRTQVARNDDGTLRAVRLKVIDNGPGFSEKVLHRAFEPYVTTKAKGTGLGLAVVRKIVEDHGARVRVRNRHAEPASGAADQPVAGAEVSISFSSFVSAAAPVSGTAAKAANSDNNRVVSASR